METEVIASKRYSKIGYTVRVLGRKPAAKPAARLRALARQTRPAQVPDARATAETFLSASPRDRAVAARERADRAAAEAERQRQSRLRPADPAGATVPPPPDTASYVRARSRGASHAEAVQEARR